MYIHIGEDLNIRAKDIIAILDKECVNSSELVEEFLKHHGERLINLSKNPFKSVVITYDKVFLSPISSGTLKRRSSQKYIQEC
ncbi:extracellular matrix/biofilm biosynthesis regulator RemA family protein [Neobacillus sp. FSL H8-0543]|uniref:extracellular matrix regulator RemB n=1 Tax=Neobacillus sp. FSL H8-0543 TaxID=2954672 RepID=UPI003158792F